MRRKRTPTFAAIGVPTALLESADMRSRFVGLPIVMSACFVTWAGTAWAQSENAGADTTVAGFPVVRAVRVESVPRLDGVVLGDPAWDNVPPASGFRQTTPDEGEAASETHRGSHRLRPGHPLRRGHLLCWRSECHRRLG